MASGIFIKLNISPWREPFSSLVAEYPEEVGEQTQFQTRDVELDVSKVEENLYVVGKIECW